MRMVPTQLGFHGKQKHHVLADNMSGSYARMHSQIRKLKGNKKNLKEYHSIIQNQLETGIIEVTPENPTGERVFYMPHKAVIRQEAETTKL